MIIVTGYIIIMYTIREQTESKYSYNKFMLSLLVIRLLIKFTKCVTNRHVVIDMLLFICRKYVINYNIMHFVKAGCICKFNNIFLNMLSVVFIFLYDVSTFCFLNVFSLRFFCSFFLSYMVINIMFCDGSIMVLGSPT